MTDKGKEYYAFDRPEMLNFIPSNVTTTIEFGCSNGKFSHAVKSKYKTESWGVDIDSVAIGNATNKLDKALLGDAFEVMKDLPENYFDCVICNDFLEHIIDPQAFLVALRPYLKKNAYLVCSLPNVRYWKNIGELIFEKDWRYREEGILDNTHLRFFTKKSIIRLMDESGLNIETIKGLMPAKSLRFIIPNYLTFKIHDDMQYLQFGITAKF